MAGVVPAETIMKDRLAALGYVEVETERPTILGPPGLRFRGHQFRYSELAEVDASGMRGRRSTSSSSRRQTRSAKA